jgi:hypothetical protein
MIPTRQPPDNPARRDTCQELLAGLLTLRAWASDELVRAGYRPDEVKLAIDDLRAGVTNRTSPKFHQSPATGCTPTVAY